MRPSGPTRGRRPGSDYEETASDAVLELDSLRLVEAEEPTLEVLRIGDVLDRPLQDLAGHERVALALSRGRGSVGRAQPCQGWGRRFESGRPLQHTPKAG